MLTVDIHKRLGTFDLDVSFETDKEVMGLLGASGCGKSMTLKCIAGIERPDSGRIILNGRTLFDSEKKIDLKPQKRRVGYMFQQYALFPNMTTEQNIYVGSREKDKLKRRADVAEKIRSMHLEGLEKKRPGQLSCGQQQRIALARILINEPELLLFDEPFSALDSYLQWQLEMELSDAIKAFGRGAVFVSHNRGEIYRLCDSVCILDRGKSEKKQPIQEMFDSPETLAACLLSGCKNYSRAVRIGDFVDAVDWGVKLKPDAAIADDIEYVGLRAHYISLSSEATGENCFPCSVERIVENTFSTVVMLKTPGGESGRSLLRVELGKNRWSRLEDSKTLYASVSPKDVMLLRG